MGTFKLPDLGEGLAEAEILEWHVQPGDHVLVDQPMVSVETAKAVVEVPVPYSGRVAALHGAVGDIIATGARLIDLEPTPTGTGMAADPRSAAIAGPSANGTAAAAVTGPSADGTAAAAVTGRSANGTAAADITTPNAGVDSGTVVGSMPSTSDHDLAEPAMAARPRRDEARTRAVPLARALAQRLGLDLTGVKGSGSNGIVRLEDVLAQAGTGALRTARGATAIANLAVPAGASLSPLRGARRAMAHSMSVSRDQVSASTVCDDADIHGWTRRGDYMLRLIRAVSAAVAAEPALNAWYDAANNSRIVFEHIDLAIAVDTAGGLIVPVLRDVRGKSPDQLRAALAAQKEAAHLRSTSPADLRDFTLMLSNFGTLAGRYGIPLVVPPAVAILGAGKVREDAVAIGGAVVAHRRMPLSLSFDHRCVTGGEACRFLAAVIVDLEKPE
ncbi:MAG: 2-oxo acid dehydrogenase subunit E2 [Pseudomonadota bacterium]|nr:2-oxo acid dehydrogenase subunit E2 [Pseudomonadota bacterium]